MKDLNEQAGGQAFPSDTNFGMTLRDYFAGQAVQGLLASEVNAPLKVFAIRAYTIADCMLVERKKNDSV